MARRKQRRATQEHENTERWMVSYADFVTLLFAFFVVMYAISSVNEGKYRVLSETLLHAFKEPQVEPMPQVGEPVLSLVPQPGDFAPHSDVPEDVEPVAEQGTTPPLTNRDPTDNRLWALAGNLDSVLEPFIRKRMVEVQLYGDRVEIKMNSGTLFGSGSARLSGGALQMLRDVAVIMRPLTHTIYVEGHTDNVPIKTPEFPSNWELSAARAASVVHYLSKHGIDADRLAAIAFGEFRPIADNGTPEGRERNRRVTLVLRAETQHESDTARRMPTMDESSAEELPWAESPGGRR